MARLKIVVFLLTVCAFFPSPNFAQTAPEITVSLNEQFLNSFLDAVFTNLETPKFDFSKKSKRKAEIVNAKNVKNSDCAQSITILRESGKVKTAIRFADGKILAPLAFTGVYDFPFVGCSSFKGWAEADMNLNYDAAKGVLFGRIKVNKVDLDGVPGLASGVVARLVQSSVDSRVNPLEILRAEQVAAVVPVKYANGSIKLRAVDMKPEIVGDALNVRVSFEFSKAQ